MNRQGFMYVVVLGTLFVLSIGILIRVGAIDPISIQREIYNTSFDQGYAEDEYGYLLPEKEYEDSSGIVEVNNFVDSGFGRTLLTYIATFIGIFVIFYSFLLITNEDKGKKKKRKSTKSQSKKISANKSRKKVKTTDKITGKNVNNKSKQTRRGKKK